MSFPFDSIKDIRRDIHFHGSKNRLTNINAAFWNHCNGSTGRSCYVRFVRAKLLRPRRYKEVKQSLNAAEICISILEAYCNTGDDLFDEYYERFIDIVDTRNQESIDRCKEILQFVKYPEQNIGNYKYYTYEQLKEMAKYKDTNEYPPYYIMYFDVINEFDLVQTDQTKEQAINAYIGKFLAMKPYNSGPSIEPLTKAIQFVINRVKNRPDLVKRIRSIVIDRDMGYRLHCVSSSNCAAGTKQKDFFKKLSLGVRPELYPLVSNDIDKINRLYNLNLEKPLISERGMSCDEYLTKLIIQEDPKKERYAYESNPLHDYIGYPGMDVLDLIMQALDNVQVGKQTQKKGYENKHNRIYAIKRCYDYNQSKSREVASTDLSNATENLNMISIIDMIQHMLDQILESDTGQWCRDTFDQLYLNPIQLEYYEGTYFYVFTKRGQLQGVPASFHSMTLFLSIINIQACINAGMTAHEAMKSCLNNGDDGVIPVTALNDFYHLVDTLIGVDVVNKEKCFQSSINGSVEFCKTIYYSRNPALITGYRFSTLYKLCSDVTQIRYTQRDVFEYERNLFKWYVDMIINILDPVVDSYEYMQFYLVYKYLEEEEARKIADTIIMRYCAASLRLMINQSTIDWNRYDPIIQWCLNEANMREWYNLIPQLTGWTVTSGNQIFLDDLRILQEHYEQARMDRDIEFYIADCLISGRSVTEVLPEEGEVVTSTVETKSGTETVVGIKMKNAPINSLLQEEEVTVWSIPKQLRSIILTNPVILVQNQDIKASFTKISLSKSSAEVSYSGITVEYITPENNSGNNTNLEAIKW